MYICLYIYVYINHAHSYLVCGHSSDNISDLIVCKYVYIYMYVCMNSCICIYIYMYI